MKIASILIITLFVLNLISCDTSRIVKQTPIDTAKVPQPKYSETRIKNNIKKCTSLLKKAIEKYFLGEGEIKSCNKSITEMEREVSAYSYKNFQIVSEVERYQNIYSDIYKNRKLFRESFMLVKSIEKLSKSMSLHVDNLSKIFLNSTSSNAKNFTYINGRNKGLPDRLVLNAKLSINSDTDNEERVRKLDRMAKDAIIFGAVIKAMLYGDKKLRIQRVKNKQARSELALAKSIYSSIANDVGSLLDIAPGLYKMWYQLNDLQDITDKLVEL